jgi:hypothetical protein
MKLKIPENICNYCEYGNRPQSIHFMCEGSGCEKAMDRYEDEIIQDNIFVEDLYE